MESIPSYQLVTKPNRTPRIENLFQYIRSFKPAVCIERAYILTESYKKNECLPAMVAFGFAIGFLAAYCKIAPFVVTLAFSEILKGIAYMYQVGQNRRIDGTFLPEFIQGSTLGLSNPVWIMLVIFGLAWLVLLKTTFGRSLFAIGGNMETARLAGINVKRNLMITYALSGLMSSIGGIILCGRLAMGTSTVGDGYEMDAIAAVVVSGASLSGGVGSAWKTLIGVLLIAVLGNIMNLMGVATYPQMIIKGVIIILAVLANIRNK